MKAKKFAVIAEKSSGYETEMDISITHNGYQWTTVRIDPDEWPEVVAAVDKYLDSLNDSA